MTWVNQLIVAPILLLYWTQKGGPGSIGVYLPGNWQVPFGIVLVVDQLSALMLVLTAIVISFAMTALFLVVLLASRGLTGTDHVDGREPKE